MKLIFDKEYRFSRTIFDKEVRLFDKEDRNPVSINHQTSAQIAASGFLKYSEETGPIPDCSFYLALSMSRDANVPTMIANANVTWDRGCTLKL